jgi:ubiquinone/menaquinone biosynthesis C-methylase UbiE
MDMARIDKGYRGVGMEGPIARWYATNTGKDPRRTQEEAGYVIERAPAGARILEVAPGPGYLSIALAQTGDYSVTGLDISSTFVEIARQNAAKAGVQVDFRHGNASAMPFDAGSFDFIVCCAAFKNFSDPVGAIQEMHRVLRPGGQALISDLRSDVTKQGVQDEVARMRLGPVSAAVTGFVLRFGLTRRAYDRRQFQDLVSRTDFQSADIHEFPITLHVELHRT